MTKPQISARTDFRRADGHTATLLSSRRAALTFVLTVLAATLIQVLATPITALMQGTTAWGLRFNEPVVLAILIVGCTAQSAALLLSDRWPELSVIAVIAVYLALAIGLAVPTWLVGMYLVIALALFLLATRRGAVAAVLWASVASLSTVGVLLVWTLLIGTSPHVAVGFVLAEAARLVAPAVGGAALGVWWSAHVARVSRAQQIAEQVKREHAARVAEAQSRERMRIAQELHDVAGQHLAGLLMLSDAAVAIAPVHPDQALHLIRDVRDEGRFAAASLAGALSDLRAAGTEGGEATSDLRRAPELVDYWQRRGMVVEMHVHGEVDDLPAVVSATCYRSIQEAMTNAAKHAPGAATEVTVDTSGDSLRVTVQNEAGHADAGPERTFGLGWGLSGLRERVELLGGTVTAGPTPAGGWRVDFVVPLSNVAEPPGSHVIQ